MTTKEAVALLERYSNYDGMGIPNLAGCKEAMRVAVDALKEACPELAESEDERIRKAIIGVIKNSNIIDINVSEEKMLAYLEKQKEPHYTKRNALFDKCVENCDPAVMKKVSDEVDEMLEKEQKPVEWSEEQDYSGLSDLERAIHRGFLCAGVENVPVAIIKETAKECLELAKKELLSYADESNPAIEAMADLERTFECNPDKLPGWLKDELNKAFKKGQESSHEDYIQGYTNGYKDAEKRYNESVAYHFPNPPAINIPTWTPPCYNGGPCTNPFKDCINCPRANVVISPNTASGTSTSKAEG